VLLPTPPLPLATARTLVTLAILRLFGKPLCGIVGGRGTRDEGRPCYTGRGSVKGTNVERRVIATDKWVLVA